MFKRKKPIEHDTPTPRPVPSAEDELNTLLTRASPPRRVPVAAEPAARPAAAGIPGPGADPARRAATAAAPGSPAPARGRATGTGTGSLAEGRKRSVGKDICLKGEVTSCDVLVVEGQVELSRTDAKHIHVAAGGTFHGTVDVDEADIAGHFDGEMTARERLTVRTGGHVEGRVRYKNIVIEAGGHIAGDIGPVTGAADEAAEMVVQRPSIAMAGGERVRPAHPVSVSRTAEPAPPSPFQPGEPVRTSTSPRNSDSAAASSDRKPPLPATPSPSPSGAS